MDEDKEGENAEKVSLSPSPKKPRLLDVVDLIGDEEEEKEKEDNEKEDNEKNERGATNFDEVSPEAQVEGAREAFLSDNTDTFHLNPWIIADPKGGEPRVNTCFAPFINRDFLCYDILEDYISSFEGYFNVYKTLREKLIERHEQIWHANEVTITPEEFQSLQLLHSTWQRSRSGTS